MISKDNKYSPHTLFNTIIIIGTFLMIQACSINIQKDKDYKKDINGEQKKITEKLQIDMAVKSIFR